MTSPHLLQLLKVQTQAGRYAFLQKAAYAKALKQQTPNRQSRT